MSKSAMKTLGSIAKWLTLEVLADKHPIASLYGTQTVVIMCGESVPNTTWLITKFDIPKEYPIEVTYRDALYINPEPLKYIRGVGYATRVSDPNRRDGYYYKYYFVPDWQANRN